MLPNWVNLGQRWLVTSGSIGPGSVISGTIASGAVTQGTLASGLTVSRAGLLVDDITWTAAEDLVAGVSVTPSYSGLIVANAYDQFRMPAVGVTMYPATSGASIEIVQDGVYPVSGLLGIDTGRRLFVAASGYVELLPPSVSGATIQNVAVVAKSGYADMRWSLDCVYLAEA